MSHPDPNYNEEDEKDQYWLFYSDQAEVRITEYLGVMSFEDACDKISEYRDEEGPHSMCTMFAIKREEMIALHKDIEVALQEKGEVIMR